MIQSNLKRQKFRILAVDDDEITLRFVKVIFSDEKYDVEVARDGVEGVEKALEFSPDLIISDVVMPNMDGYEFNKEIRKNDTFKNIIFVLSSATLLEVKDAVKALKGGADDYLLKPFDKEQTRAKVDALLRIKVLQDDLFDSNEKLSLTVSELEEHKKVLEEKNRIIEKEKERLNNSLKEISYLVEELEASHQKQVDLNQEMKKNFDDVISLLSTLIELRTPEDKGHSQRVSEIASFIAEQLDLSEKERSDIEIGAALHEIGKIGIPDALFMKDPAEYSAEEKQRVMLHPLVGESLLKDYAGLGNVSKIIRHSKENIDGSGYPDGVSSNDIPLGSRIIRVASAFDNLSYQYEEVSAIYDVIDNMQKSVNIEYDAHVLQLVKEYVESTKDRRSSSRTRKVSISELTEGMVLASDLFTNSGIKLMPKDTELTESSVRSILNYHKTDPLPQGISIYQ